MSSPHLGDRGNSLETGENYTPLVTIHAGASCVGIGSPEASAGCGAVIVDRNRAELKLVAKYLGPLTSQQAEILACERALDALCRPCRIEMFSDSLYVIDTMAGKNRMKTNRPFWGQLVEASYGHHVTWRWMSSRDGVVFQEAADRLARASSATKIDIAIEDLVFLTDHLSMEFNQLNIASFGTEVDKIVSRYLTTGHPRGEAYKIENPASFPSAFSV